MRNGDDQLIGSCGFNAWNKRAFNGEIGYELLPEYWNNGYMTEAISAIVTYGFANLHLHRIEAWVVPGNVSSARVLQKTGFRSEGIMRDKGYWHGRFHDLQLFALLKTEFQSSV
jgi:ribosomal-protein-alanine N-acetyltransferase